MFKQIAAAIARVLASIPRRVLRAGRWVWETVPPIIDYAVRYPFSLIGNVVAPRVDGCDYAASQHDAIAVRNAELAQQLIQRADEKKARRRTTAELAVESAAAVLEGRRELPDVSRLPERTRVWIELLKFDRNAAAAVASANMTDVADHVAGIRKVASLPALPTEEFLDEVRKGDEFAQREIDAGRKVEIQEQYREYVSENNPYVKFA